MFNVSKDKKKLVELSLKQAEQVKAYNEEHNVPKRADTPHPNYELEMRFIRALNSPRAPKNTLR